MTRQDADDCKKDEIGWGHKIPLASARISANAKANAAAKKPRLKDSLSFANVELSRYTTAATTDTHA